MNVVIEDGGELGDSPVLARFDATSGQWAEIPGGVARTDPDHVQCDLTESASLLGLFAPGPASYWPATKTPAEADIAFKIARAKLAQAVSLAADPPNDSTVATALAALAQAARDLADACPDERGKFALAK